MDPAMPAKRVIRGAGVECVGREGVGAAEDLQPLARDGQVQDALLGADRAVALADQAFLQVGADAEPHPAAMASAFIGLEHSLSSFAARPAARCISPAIP